MPVHISRMAELTAKHIAGTLSTEEQQELDQLIDQSGELKTMFSKFNDDAYIISQLRILHEIRQSIDMEHELQLIKAKAKRMKAKYVLRTRLAAAIIVALFISSAVYFQDRFSSGTINGSNAANHFEVPFDINNKVILVKKDGTFISLDSLPNGKEVSVGNATFIKRGNTIRYLDRKPSKGNPEHNMIATGAGRIFSALLSDGSTITLNANSTARFPVSFTGGKREVEVTGESFFDVVKDKMHPFIVNASEIRIEAKGTRFNVKVSDKEQTVTTTLIEGAVNVQAGKISRTLHPGEVVVVTKGRGIGRTTKADTSKTIAWKQKGFAIDNDDLRDVIPKVADWYGLKVKFEEPLPPGRFFGTLFPRDHVEEILMYLEQQSPYKFKIVKDTILVQVK